MFGLVKRHRALKRFLHWAVEEGSRGTFHSLNGVAIRLKAIEFGLLEVEPYSFERHGDRNSPIFDDTDIEDGDDWYSYPPGLR